MSKFTPVRNPISGQFDATADITPGEYSMPELAARNAARQAAMNKAIEADLQSFGASGSTGSPEEEIFWKGLPEDHEELVGSRLPKTDPGGERYGKR